MSVVDLNDGEWGELMSIIADAPWKRANPLLMKIGEQLRAQHVPGPRQSAPPGGAVKIEVPQNGNGSQEVQRE